MFFCRRLTRICFPANTNKFTTSYKSLNHVYLRRMAQNNEPSKKYSFSLSTFNIWCPYWNGNEHEHPELWKKRHNKILNVLCNNSNDKNAQKQEHKNNENELEPLSLNCDIYCIQEFWCDNSQFVAMYDNYCKARNYSLYYLTRNSKHKPDGIAVLINNKSFKLINKFDHKYDPSNRVAICMELEHIKSGNHITLGSTHLTFPSHPHDTHIRKEQCKQFISLLNEKVSKDSSYMILSGDFNCEINQSECIQCIDAGYKSSFHQTNPNIKSKIVSHYNHDEESVFVDHIFYKDNPDVAKLKKFSMKPTDSYLYPRNVAIEKWPTNKEWDLTDHRPLVTVFEMSML